MGFVIFDTEYTAWEGSVARKWGGPGEHKEIVQIGAIRLDDALNEVAAFDVVARPLHNPILSDYFIALTGVTQARLDAEGVPLTEAWADFMAFADGAPMYCYGRDDIVVAECFALQGLGPVTVPEASNLGHWFRAQGIDTARVNSGRLAEVAGTSFTGREHDACADCRSIAAAIRAFMARGAPSPFGASR